MHYAVNKEITKPKQWGSYWERCSKYCRCCNTPCNHLLPLAIGAILGCINEWEELVTQHIVAAACGVRAEGEAMMPRQGSSESANAAEAVSVQTPATNAQNVQQQCFSKNPSRALLPHLLPLHCMPLHAILPAPPPIAMLLSPHF